MKVELGSSESGEARTRPSLVARARRLGGYAFWSAAAFALPIALDRLIVCPVLKRYLGDDVFGGFVWLLGIVNVFGLTTGSGFSNFLARDLAQQTTEGARRMMRVTLLVTAGMGAVVFLVGGFASYWVADEVVQARAGSLYGPLCAFGLVRCVEWIFITSLRFRRLFITVFLLKVVEAAVLLVVLLVAPSRSLGIVGGIYVASVLMPLGLGAYLSRREIGWGSWWDRRAVGQLLTTWPGLALSALIDASLSYAPRIVLGVLGSSAAVTVLFAGTSVANVFVMPISLAGAMVLALLATKTSYALAGRMGKVYLALTLATAAALGFATYFIGRILLGFLYPDTAPAALEFFPWLAFGSGCATVIVLLRPVALKYGRVRHIVALSSATLGLQLVALFLLVPMAGAWGAAVARALSSALAAALWLAFYGLLMVRADNNGAAFATEVPPER